MAYNYRRPKKKTIKEKVEGGLRRAFATVALVSVPAVPLAYTYGTVQQDTIKVTDWDTHSEFNYETYTSSDPDYEIKTNKGSFWDRNSLLHGKGDAKTQDIWNTVQRDKFYDIKYYGVDFLFLERNLLSVSEVSPETLKKREEERKRQAAAARQALQAKPAAQQQQQQPAGQQAPAAQQGQQPAPAAGQPAGALSGRVMPQDLVSADGKYSIQVTIPVEAVGKVTINTVTSLQPAAVPAPAAAPAPVTPPPPRAPGL